jgi:hypothetical protein
MNAAGSAGRLLAEVDGDVGLDGEVEGLEDEDVVGAVLDGVVEGWLDEGGFAELVGGLAGLLERVAGVELWATGWVGDLSLPAFIATTMATTRTAVPMAHTAIASGMRLRGRSSGGGVGSTAGRPEVGGVDAGGFAAADFATEVSRVGVGTRAEVGVAAWSADEFEVEIAAGFEVAAGSEAGVAAGVAVGAVTWDEIGFGVRVGAGAGVVAGVGSGADAAAAAGSGSESGCGPTVMPFAAAVSTTSVGEGAANGRVCEGRGLMSATGSALAEDSPSSRCQTSLMVGRSAGSGLSIHMMVSVSGPERFGCRISLRTTRSSSAMALTSSPNGGVPSTAAYRVAPSEKTSAGNATGCPCATSGAV